MGTAGGKYKWRVLQGGATVQKVRMWYAALYRFRYRISAVAVVVVFPYHPHLQQAFLTFFSRIGSRILSTPRPYMYSPGNDDVFVLPT